MGQEILRKGSIYAEGLLILIMGPDYIILITLSASATFKGDIEIQCRRSQSTLNVVNKLRQREESSYGN